MPNAFEVEPEQSRDEQVDRGDELKDDEPAETPEAEAEPSEPDTDSEGEETDEERVAREAEEAEAEKKRRIRIPKHRVDEMVGKERARAQALADELAALKAQQAQARHSADLGQLHDQIEKLNDEYEDLLMDGDKEKARQVRRQLQQLQSQYNEATIATRTEEVRRATLTNVKYEQALDRLEAQYPELNPNSDAFDHDRTVEVAELMEAFQLKGASKLDALNKAVKYVFRDVSATATAPTPDRRAVEARKRAADANKRQPPQAAGLGKPSDAAGIRGDGVDVGAMSLKAFESLTDEQLARLRGDDL